MLLQEAEKQRLLAERAAQQEVRCAVLCCDPPWNLLWHG
jgi:hypothetical protein